jgi:hypothetical protein
VLASQFLAELLESLDPIGHAVEWFAPEELDVGLGGGHLFGGGGGAAEVEPGVSAFAAGDRSQCQG